jgi:flagellar basal body-associated protein FliL
MSKNTIIFSICMLIVAAGLGYYFFFFETGSESGITSEAGAASDVELAFIELVGKIDPITFDTTILSDPRFTARQDIRTTIIPEPSGRRDPFAPLGR